MNEETAARIVQLLEGTDPKFDRLDENEGLLQAIKMDVSGFEHEGKQYPGSGGEIISATKSMKSELVAIEMTLNSIETNTSS